jgi:hypothetical protein
VDPSIREEGRAKVEYKIDPSELLEGLDEDTRECAEADATIRSTEAVKVRTCAYFLLLLQVETNLSELRLNLRIINRKRGEAGKCLRGIRITMFLD